MISYSFMYRYLDMKMKLLLVRYGKHIINDEKKKKTNFQLPCRKFHNIKRYELYEIVFIDKIIFNGYRMIQEDIKTLFL